MNIAEIRRLRLEALVAKQPGRAKQRGLAAAIGKAPAQISQWINGTRTINEESARAIEKKLKLTERWMDNEAEAWPFPLVARERWEKLSPDDQAYVQSVMNLAISQREPLVATVLSTSDAAGAERHVVHQRNQSRYGT